jgi:hypothetical protein
MVGWQRIKMQQDFMTTLLCSSFALYAKIYAFDYQNYREGMISMLSNGILSTTNRQKRKLLLPENYYAHQAAIAGETRLFVSR